MAVAESDRDAPTGVIAFREGLQDAGWTEGRNLWVDYHWAGGDISRITAFAKVLVELSPDIMLAYATPSVKTLQKASPSIPIVFLSVTHEQTCGPVGRHPAWRPTFWSQHCLVMELRTPIIPTDWN